MRDTPEHGRQDPASAALPRHVRGAFDGCDPSLGPDLGVGFRPWRHRRVEQGQDHQALRCAVPGIAGGKGQLRSGRGVENGIVVWSDDLRAGHVVSEQTLAGEDEDGVPASEFVQVVEGGGEGGPMAGYRSVARLTRKRRPLIVTGPTLELSLAGPLHQDVVQTQLGDGNQADGLPDARGSSCTGDRGGHSRQPTFRIGTRACRAEGAERQGGAAYLVSDLLSQVALCVIRVEGGAPELERHERHQKSAGPEQDGADPPPDPASKHEGSLRRWRRGKATTARTVPTRARAQGNRVWRDCVWGQRCLDATGRLVYLEADPISSGWCLLRGNREGAGNDRST